MRAASTTKAPGAVPGNGIGLQGLCEVKWEAVLGDVNVPVWAELGRTRMSLSDALRLPQGSVIELDQGADDAIELFVNGLPFADGTLAITAEGDWAIQVGTLS